LNRTAPSGLYTLTHRVRWRIYGFLFVFGFIAYFQQKGLTVAAERIMPDLHFSQVQIGWLESAFVLGYALFQFPGGVLGQRLGARLVFTLIGAVAFLATVLTPLAPVLLQGSALLMAMIALQFVLGLAQGPIFPVSTGVMESWFAPQRWAWIQGLQSSALQLAAAATAPLVAYLMSTIGWQQALIWPALPAAGVVALWAWYGRNTPQEHRSVSAAEIAELGHRPEEQAQSPDHARSAGAHPDQPFGAAAQRLLCVHELRVLSHFQLVFSLFGPGAPLHRARERPAVRAAAVGRRRGGISLSSAARGAQHRRREASSAASRTGMLLSGATPIGPSAGSALSGSAVQLVERRRL
jgi:MFS family permease